MSAVPSVSGALIAMDMAFTLKRFTRAVMAVKRSGKNEADVSPSVFIPL